MNEEKDVILNSRYWDAFYKQNRGNVPSQFCVSVLTELDAESVIVELGSGNGRDSLYFVSQGHTIVAMDISHQAISNCEEQAIATNRRDCKFFQGDLARVEDLTKTIDYARDKAQGRPLNCYSRFVMHSLDEVQEAAFLQTLSKLLFPEEFVYFEFRSKEDASLKKLFGGHYRRYIDTDEFSAALTNELGFDVEYRITGRGMAKYKDEDPFISRIIAKKK